MSGSFEQFLPLIPNAEIKPPKLVKFQRLIEVEAKCNAAAIGDPAQRWSAIVNAAAMIIQVDALSVRLVGEHHCPRDIWMRLRQIPFVKFVRFEPDGISPTTERAAVAGDIPCGLFARHVRIYSGG